MPLPGGGDYAKRNKSTIIAFMKSVEPDNKNPVYDSIHSFYGIIDDDNDSLRGKTDYLDIMNLFALKRYSKENYVLDPINIYFHLKSLTDKESGQNKNRKILLEKINEKGVESFSLKEIYQEIQKPSEENVRAIKTFLQTIVDIVGTIVFDIIFKTGEGFSKFKLTKTNTKLDTDSENYDFLKQFLVNEKTIVSVLGIELKYSKFFTCIQGHFLEKLLNDVDIFGRNVVCDKIIKKFKQTCTGMFIPDEIINIYRTICDNIIDLNETSFKKFVKEKHSNKNWFILYNSNDCEEFNR